MTVERWVEVLEPGPLATVQDEGRLGQSTIGVGRSGACDRGAYRLANRLVGNVEGAAALEVTFGGLRLRVHADVLMVTTGARCPGAPHNAPTRLEAGSELGLGPPATGLRTYLAVRGGFEVQPVLGSRATDLLSGLGPPVLQRGDRLRVGREADREPHLEVAPVGEPEGGPVRARVVPGPRRDWFPDEAWQSLLAQSYTVSNDSNRVGVRLEGEPLERLRDAELPSEGMIRGALQIPPSGTPVLFLADHPVTGGYPVIGYVVDGDVDKCAQLRPGQTLRFGAGLAPFLPDSQEA